MSALYGRRRRQTIRRVSTDGPVVVVSAAAVVVVSLSVVVSGNVVVVSANAVVVAAASVVVAAAAVLGSTYNLGGFDDGKVWKNKSHH